MCKELSLSIASRYYFNNSTFFDYNKTMAKMIVKDFIKQFRTMIGDATADVPTNDFIIDGLNWAMRELPINPKLHKIFAKKYEKQLDAKHHYRWRLNGDFKQLLDIPAITFWTSTGGELCPLKLCHKRPEDFTKLGIPSLMHPGVPCFYTLENDDDDTFLVLDRPANIPIIISYIAYGIPQEVTSPDDTIEMPTAVINAILSTLRTVYYREADDMAFSQAIDMYLDNKTIPQLVQLLNRNWGSNSPVIVGEQ